MSRAVEEMFSAIAARYDTANTVLSFGIHHLWRAQAARMMSLPKNPVIIDACCGTGDLSFEMERKLLGSGKVYGLDFALPMVKLAKKKQAKREQEGQAKGTKIVFLQGDALSLPFPDTSCHGVMISFGIRNVDSVPQFLLEAKRVLKPGGELLVLEFGQPRLPIFRNLYSLYSNYLMPHIGAFITGRASAFRYLPETASRFPAAEAFVQLMKEASFTNLSSKSFLSGVAYAYLGKKAELEQESINKQNSEEGSQVNQGK